MTNQLPGRVALRAHEEGAGLVLTNTPVAMRMGEINQLSAICDAPIIPADATRIEDMENLVSEVNGTFRWQI